MTEYFTDEDIEKLRRELARVGWARYRGPRGNLYLISSSIMSEHQPDGILVAYEGFGTMFCDLSQPLNRFELMQSGFSHTIADMLAGVLNAIFGFEYRVTIRVPYRRDTGESLLETERNEP